MAEGSGRNEIWRWIAMVAVSLIIGWAGGQFSSASNLKEIEADVAKLEEARERIEKQQALDGRELTRLSGDQLDTLREIRDGLARIENQARRDGR